MKKQMLWLSLISMIMGCVILVGGVVSLSLYDYLSPNRRPFDAGWMLWSDVSFVGVAIFVVGRISFSIIEFCGATNEN